MQRADNQTFLHICCIRKRSSPDIFFLDTEYPRICTRQIDAVIRSVDSNKTADHSGYYIFTKQWIVEHLAITEEEANSIGFLTYINKRERTKQENRRNKQERNTKIIEMHSGGVVHSDIAKALGISLRTVQTVIKEAGLSRTYKTKCNVQKNAA